MSSDLKQTIRRVGLKQIFIAERLGLRNDILSGAVTGRLRLNPEDERKVRELVSTVQEAIDQYLRSLGKNGGNGHGGN